MTAATPVQSSPSRQPRSPVVYLAAGCAAVLLCLVCVGAAAGGYFYFNQPKAQAKQPAVEYILDVSPRMAQPAQGDTGTRLEVAQGVLAEIVRPADPQVTAGLRVFGTGAQAASCQDTDLVVPLAISNQPQISTHLLTLKAGPNPDAAMGQAMVSAIRDLTSTAGPQTLVVVTGGADSCNPEAAQLIAAEAKRAGITLQLFVVGYQVPDDQGAAIQDVVDATGNGKYVNAHDRAELKMILDSVQQYVDNPNTNTVADVLTTATAAAIGPGGGSATSTLAPGDATQVANATASAASTAAATAAAGNATAAPSTGSAPTSGQTACDHPYFPMRPGATWTFSTESGSMVWVVTDVTGDQNDANATMSFSFQDLSGEYHWHCTPAGIETFDFSMLSSQSLGGTLNSKVTNRSGFWLLSADQLVPGAAWENAHTLEYSISAAGASMSVTNNVTEAYTVAGSEARTVAGVDHDSLRVDHTSHSVIQASIGPATTLDIPGTMWFVRGIGPVQFNSTVNGSSSSSVLESYSIP